MSRRSTTWSALGALLFGAFAVPTPASAARERKSVLVLRVEAANLAPEVVAKLDAGARAQAAASLKNTKLLPPPALDLESMKIAAGCGDDGPECLANIGSTLGATQVFRIVISPVRDKTRVSFSFVRVKDKRVKQSKVDLDELGEDAVEEFRWHVAAALGDKRPAPPGAIVLVTTGEPGALEGVEVFLDDRKFPVTALRNLPAGDHRLEVHKEGFETVIWTGAVRPGRETKVTVNLQPVPGTAPPPEPPVEPPVAAQVTPEVKPEIAPRREEPKVQPEPVLTPAATTEVGEGPDLLYTYVFAGAAVAATAVGVFYWRKQADIEAKLEAECNLKPQEPDGRLGCTNLSYQPCQDYPNREECVDGRMTQTATLIAFPLAGALGAAAIAAFFLEDGPMIFGGSSSSGDDVGTGLRITGAAIVPFPDGVAATLSASY